ncbi:MAG: PIN domain-containing protein [Solirubrobacterales bacterium]
MIRALADTNLLVAALTGPADSPAADFVSAHREGAFELVTSPRLIAELDGVLRRPAIAASAAGLHAAEFVDHYAASALFVDDVFDPPRATADRTGDFLVAVARAGGAGYIVTEDQTLASSYVRGIRIATADEFNRALERAGVHAF